MKKIVYYQFMQWDGGDRHYQKDPRFFNEADAEAFLGDNKYDYFEKETIHIYESVDEYNKVNRKKVEERALAKLTDEEKQALGLI